MGHVPYDAAFALDPHHNNRAFMLHRESAVHPTPHARRQAVPAERVWNRVTFAVAFLGVLPLVTVYHQSGGTYTDRSQDLPRVIHPTEL